VAAVSEDYLPDELTLGEARVWLRERVEEGTTCPCCQQYTKLYAKRQLHGTIAATLINVYRRGEEWVYLPSVPQRSRDFAFVTYWFLAEQAKEKREDGVKKGLWRITPKGVNWVENRIKIPKYARVYDNQLIRLWGEPVSIIDVLGTRFDYPTLMGW
jgi:hypothetical protein